MKFSTRRARTAWMIFGWSVVAGAILSIAFYGMGRWVRQSWLAATPGRLYGAELNPPRPAVGFTLNGSDPRTHTLDEFRGQVVLLYFGYSACPEDCLAMLAKLAAARDRLGTQSSQVQVLFITIDPAQDTPERLAQALAGYGEGFLGLAGKAAETKEIANNYDVSYQDAPSGEIKHTPLAMLIDQAGFSRAVYPAGIAVDELAADLRQVLNEDAQVP